MNGYKTRLDFIVFYNFKKFLAEKWRLFEQVEGIHIQEIKGFGIINELVHRKNLNLVQFRVHKYKRKNAPFKNEVVKKYSCSSL